MPVVTTGILLILLGVDIKFPVINRESVLSGFQWFFLFQNTVVVPLPCCPLFISR